MHLEEILKMTGLTLKELLKIVDEWITKGIILKENSELKKALVNFAEDLATFQTLVNSTMSQNKQQGLEIIEKNSNMLSEKIASLLTSNQQLEKSLSSELRIFTKEMTSLVDSQKERFEKMAQDMAAASRSYAKKVQTDVEEAHREHKLYMRGLNGRNAAQVLYLAITPALVLLDFLSRFFGWF